MTPVAHYAPSNRYLDVERLQPMAVRVYEVETAVHPIVDYVFSVQAALVPQIPLELLIDVSGSS